MADVTLADVKASWVGVEFSHADFTIERQRMLDWATALGETDPRFVDPDHPDFQAHPMLVSCFGTGRMLPDDFPELGSGGGIDGGKSVLIHAPIREGDVLTGHSLIADIYEKTGRSGTMIFIVHRINFSNQRGELVATVDWRMIRAAGDGR